MHNKKLVAAAGVAALALAAGTWYQTREFPAVDGVPAPAPPPAGHVNPEASTAAMTTKVVPQLSGKRFEPPRSGATLMVVEPALRPPVVPENSKKTGR